MNVEGRKETAGWMSPSPSVVNVAMETAQSSCLGKQVNLSDGERETKNETSFI